MSRVKTLRFRCSRCTDAVFSTYRGWLRHQQRKHRRAMKRRIAALNQ